MKKIREWTCIGLLCLALGLLCLALGLLHLASKIDPFGELDNVIGERDML